MSGLHDAISGLRTLDVRPEGGPREEGDSARGGLVSEESLLPRHGGYRRLKSFRVAKLCQDLTVRFCDRYIDRRSRTHDQMVQAARSGVQNIAEGSQASGTSKKMELKLTNVARASLEELRLDYEDYLRQRGMQAWAPEHPALVRFRERRCESLEEVRSWVEDERRRDGRDGKHGRARTDTDRTDRTDAPVRGGPCPSVSSGSSGPSGPPSSAELAANAALSLLNVACYLLDRQVQALATAFLEEGGFTERLYRLRRERRSRNAGGGRPERGG